MLKSRAVYWVLSISIISSSLGCRTDKKDWEQAHSSDTVVSYNHYLNLHPMGKYAYSAKLKIEELQIFDVVKSLNLFPPYQSFLELFQQSSLWNQAQSLMEQLYDKRHPEFRFARTATVFVSLHFEEMENAAFGFERIAKKVMTYAGLTLIDAKSEEPGIILRIDVKGKPLSAGYFNGTLYTGADLSGTILFQTSKGFIYKETFKGRIDPPSIAVFDRFSPLTAPDKAPWEGVFGSFYDKFVDMIYDIFGYPILVSVLSDPNLGLSARNKLIEIKDPDAVASLLNIVNLRNQLVEIKVTRMRFQIGDPYIFIRILNCLNLNFDNWDTGYPAVENALYILGELKDPRTVEPLINAIEHSWIIESIVRSLKKITGQDFGSNRMKWKEWWEDNKGTFIKDRQ